MSRGFVLLLVTSAVIAALIAVAPIAFDDGGSPVCRNPDHPQVSFTRAAASGGHVVGLTEFEDDAAVTVQFVGRRGLEAVEDPLIQIRGAGARDLAVTDRPGCYVVEGSVPEHGEIFVTATAGTEEIRATVVRDRLDLKADEVISTMRRATAALTGLQELQRVGRRDDEPRETVRVSYSPGGYRVRGAGQAFEQKIDDWQKVFYWSSPETFTSATPTHRVARNGTQLVWLSGYVPVPLWLEVLVDPETGAVHEQRMLAAQHFMNSSFSDFRRQSDVVPGPRDSARTDS